MRYGVNRQSARADEQTVQKEIRERVLKTPNLGIKLATWEIE
jgi:hypothetical protein